MEPGDVEALALSFYERLGFDPSRPIDTFRLARRRLGPDAIVRGAGIVGLPAKLFTVHGEQRIAINRRLPAPAAQFFVGHEIGHVICDEVGYREDDLEQVCDSLAACLMAPRPAMRQLRLAFGDDYEALADEVCATESWAALRVAEVTGRPTALVAPLRVRVRGGEWAWPDETRIRQLARRGARGISRANLRDDPRRVVLAVDEIEAA